MDKRITRRSLKKRKTCAEPEMQETYIKEEIMIPDEAYERELYPTDANFHCFSVQVQSIVKEEAMSLDNADLIDDASLNVNEILNDQLLLEQVEDNEFRKVNHLIKKLVEPQNNDSDASQEACKFQLDPSHIEAEANNDFNQSSETVSKTLIDNRSIIISNDASEDHSGKPFQNINLFKKKNSAKRKKKISKKKEIMLKNIKKEEVQAKLKTYCPKCKQSFESFDIGKIKECMKCRAVLITHCVKCKLRFRLSSSAFEHARKDKCKPKPTFHCHHCNYKSQYKQVLSRHIESQHLTKGPEDFFKCSKCGKCFKMKYDRESHEKLCGQAFLKCHFCEFRVNVSNIEDFIESPATIRSIQKVIEDPIVFGSVTVNSKKKPLKTKLFVFSCGECKSIEKGSFHNGTKKCQKCDAVMKYVCLNCKAIHPNICAIYRHLNECIIHKYYYCNDCDYKVTERKKMQRHVLSKHVYQFDTNKNVKCLQCNEKFHGWENMYKHESVCEQNVFENHNSTAGIQRIPINSGTELKVNLENKLFSMTRNMTKEEIHQTDHLVKEYCPKCGNNNISNKNSRVKCAKCQSLNNFLCLHTLCNAKFTTLPGIRYHIKRIHLYGGQKISGICKSCGKNVDSLWALWRHSRNCGIEAELHGCDICDYKTKSKWKISRHKIKKHRKLVAHKICVCEKCGKEFLDTKTLNRHEKHFCSKPNMFKCTNCYYTCYNRTKMTAHLKDKQCLKENLKSK